MRWFGLGWVCMAVLVLACGGGSGAEAGGGGLLGEAPLDAEECGQLLDQIHDVVGQGLSDEDWEQYEADRDRGEEIDECLEEQAWDRPGMECVMKAETQSDLNRCIMKN